MKKGLYKMGRSTIVKRAPGWLIGWIDGCKSRSKGCLQQSKSNQKPGKFNL
jgi:hypothetical protein